VDVADFEVQWELVSANSGRRQYRCTTGTLAIRVRLHHDRKGWTYRLDDADEVGPYSTVEAARGAAFDAMEKRLRAEREYGRGERKGPPQFVGSRGKLHGVILHWTDIVASEFDGTEVRHFTCQCRGMTGKLVLRLGGDGVWRYRLMHPGGKQGAPVTYGTPDDALDAATRAFAVEAKRARKRKALDGDDMQ
jgi:hypothetical protein